MQDVTLYGRTLQPFGQGFRYFYPHLVGQTVAEGKYQALNYHNSLAIFALIPVAILELYGIHITHSHLNYDLDRLRRSG